MGSGEVIRKLRRDVFKQIWRNLSEIQSDHRRLVHSLECPCRHYIFRTRLHTTWRTYGSGAMHIGEQRSIDSPSRLLNGANLRMARQAISLLWRETLLSVLMIHDESDHEDPKAVGFNVCHAPSRPHVHCTCSSGSSRDTSWPDFASDSNEL